MSTYSVHTVKPPDTCLCLGVCFAGVAGRVSRLPLALRAGRLLDVLRLVGDAFVALVLGDVLSVATMTRHKTSGERECACDRIGRIYKLSKVS